MATSHLAHIGDALIATDMAGRVTLLNPVAEELTGWATDEATGLPLEQVFQIINEESRQPVEHPVAKVLREGHVVGLANHTLLIHRDGSERSIDDSAAPIRDSDGEISGVVLIFRDITERRRAERAVSDALDYANNIVETIREPMLVLDGQLRVRTANRSFYRAFQVGPEETEGRLLYDLGDGQWNIPALRKLLEEILPQNTSFDDFEVTHEFVSIGRRVMLLNARRIKREGNQTRLILLAVEDITERRRLEDERRELETRFIYLVKNIRDHSIFTLDIQGRITSWNLEAERILGFTEAEAARPALLDHLYPRRRGSRCPRPRTDHGPGRRAGRGRALALAKERGAILGAGHRVADARGHGPAHRLLEILRDMTDRKMAEEALRRPTAARTSSWRRWPTNCATRWPRSATACRSCSSTDGDRRHGRSRPGR